jgi:hybrid cluster-associated redox disulfide protein
MIPQASKKIALDFSPRIGIINANTRGFGLLLSGRKNNMEITKETTMGEMLEYDMGIAYVLMQAGMHCVGCPSSIGESLEMACAVHGLDPDVVLANIQEYLAGRA